MILFSKTSFIFYTLALGLPLQQNQLPNFGQTFVFLSLIMLWSLCLIAFLLALILLLPQVSKRNQTMVVRAPLASLFYWLGQLYFSGGHEFGCL